MDIDDDDDFYAPAESIPPSNEQQEPQNRSYAEIKPGHQEEDLEEGEEDEGEEDGSDSDIDIITERKDGTKAAPPSQSRYNEIRNIPQRATSSDATLKPTSMKKEPSLRGSVPLGTDMPAVPTSKIDVSAKPIYEPTGKSIMEINIDEDLPDNDKPWRRPGTDISDYFNYGFDEFTWTLYASKQENLRSEFDQDKIAQSNKKMFEDMNMMMAMGGLPGLPNMPSGSGGATAGIPLPGMEGIPAEMQAVMQQMMAQGIDLTQMDPSAMFAGISTGQAGTGTAGPAQGSNPNQGFSSQQGFGQGQTQQGFSYDQNMINGVNRGNFRGRGRAHRNW